MIDAKRALLSDVVGRAVVSHAAQVLAPAGIPVLVLKGVWLQACVYPPHEARVVTDVDLLVPEHEFERALRQFERCGWRRGAGNLSEQTLQHEDFQLPIDLHRRLFTRGAFRLPTHAVLERSRSDQTAYGVQVQLPDPRDALAHLVGHFVKSRTSRDDPMRLRDFMVIAERCGLDPEDSARHMHAVGMARAARYALRPLVEQQNTFYGDLLAALPRDVIGAPLATLAHALARHSPRSSMLGAAPGFLVDRSLPAGARALWLRTLDRRRERAQ